MQFQADGTPPIGSTQSEQPEHSENLGRNSTKPLTQEGIQAYPGSEKNYKDEMGSSLVLGKRTFTRACLRVTEPFFMVNKNLSSTYIPGSNPLTHLHP